MQRFITSLGIFLKGSVNRSPSLRARDWNERIVAPCEAAQLRPGAHSTVIRTARGQVLNFDPSLGWIHPWFVSGRWGRDGFYFRVRPGFVNGEAPVVTTASESAPAVTLLDGPDIPARNWRAVTGAEEPLPAFFERLGVRKAASDIKITDNGVSVDVTQREENATPPRLLVAMDVWLAVARATYQSEIRIADPTGVTGEVVDYNVRYDTTNFSRVGAQPRLQWGGKFVPVRAPTLEERLQGQFQDEGEDRVLISTLYLLSPENAQEHVPTPQWQLFRANNCFWNLGHAARNVAPKVNPPPIRIFTGLLGGVGDIIGNQILSGVNEYSDRILNAVNTTTNEGRFWTV